MNNENLGARKIPRYVYISGPIRGIPTEQYREAFFAAEEQAIALGWRVFNPVRMDDNEPAPTQLDEDDLIRHYFTRDMEVLGRMHAELGDAIAMLPGWEQSKGARAELAAAMWLELQVLDARTFEPLATTIVTATQQQAERLPKRMDCGEPECLETDDKSEEPITMSEVQQLAPRLPVCLNPECEAVGEPVPHGEYTEVRATDPATGGQKGQKDERLLRLIEMAPPGFLTDLGAVYEMGAKKYTRDNWRRGYPWSWSFNALLRHIGAMARGEWRDTESGLPHAVHAAWHCATLHEFERAGLGTDDRIPHETKSEEVKAA